MYHFGENRHFQPLRPKPPSKWPLLRRQFRPRIRSSERSHRSCWRASGWNISRLSPRIAARQTSTFEVQSSRKSARNSKKKCKRCKDYNGTKKRAVERIYMRHPVPISPNPKQARLVNKLGRFFSFFFLCRDFFKVFEFFFQLIFFCFAVLAK